MRIAEGPVFMHPDRLVIWANELLNALGMVSGLVSGYQEGISNTSRVKAAGLSTQHAILQVMQLHQSGVQKGVSRLEPRFLQPL
jgi:hypothetical protein